MSPIAHPAGTWPVPPHFTPNEAVLQPHTTTFHFDVLDLNDVDTGVDLQGVNAGGTLTWDSTTAVHASGTLTVTDTGQDINWLQSRIRPVMTITQLDGTHQSYPLGVWLPTTHPITWAPTGATWALQLTGKLGALDTAVPVWSSDPSSGRPFRYSMPAGADQLDAVGDLIENAGGNTSQMPVDYLPAQSAMSFPLGTTTLAIANGILSAAGYRSLYTDMLGNYRTQPYVPPPNRQPRYTGSFTDGQHGVITAPFTHARDAYDVPNLVMGTSSGTSGGNVTLFAYSTNTDPNSPFSYQNRGRWIADTNLGLTATSQDALQAQCDKILAQATAAASTFTITHQFLPGLQINDALMLTTSDTYGSYNTLCYVSALSITLDATGLCQSTLAEATPR